MANIRDQCSWVHMHEPERATQKSKDLVSMAVAKGQTAGAAATPALGSINKSGLVIGGGISGMTAALALAEQGSDAYLVEKEKELGGHLRQVRYMLNGEDPQDELQNAKAQVFKNQSIHLFTGATIEGVEGSIGDFRTNVPAHGKRSELKHGVVIVATGANSISQKNTCMRKTSGYLRNVNWSNVCRMAPPSSRHAVIARRKLWS